VRIGQGWTSAMRGYDEIVAIIARLGELLDDDGRSLANRGDGQPFAIQVAGTEQYCARRCAELEEAGDTDGIGIPVLIEGEGDDAPLDAMCESLARFGEKYISA